MRGQRYLVQPDGVTRKALSFAWRSVQINGAEVGDPQSCAAVVREALPRVPQVEWILQRNDETLPLW